MTEQEKQEAEALRLIKQFERQQIAQDAEQQRDELELRIIEAQALLAEVEESEQPILSIAFFRKGDPLPVLSSEQQGLALAVLRQVLALDRDKLTEL